MNNGKKGGLGVRAGAGIVMIMLFFSMVWMQPSCVSQDAAKVVIAGTGERNAIRGYINDSATGVGISGAFFGVAFFDGGGPLNFTKTDGTGYFALNVYDGNYMCFAASPSHNMSIKTLGIGGGQTKIIKFGMVPCRARTATVKGYLKDGATALPIANTDIVNLIGPSSGMPEYININRTDATGYFSVKMPPGSGQLSLVVPIPGYYSNTTDYTVGDGETIWANLTLSPLLPGKGTVKGYVNESGTGNPVQYAVASASTTDQTYINSTYTDNSGYFEFDCIPGDLELTVGAYEHSTFKSIFTCANGSVQWFNITLNPVQELATLKGYVKDGSTGKAIPSAILNAVDPPNYTYSKIAVTENNGYYEMSTINGPLTVYTNVRGYYMNNSDVLMYDNKATWLNFTLDPAICNSTVLGYITDGVTSKPVQGANVQASNQDTWYDSTTSGTDGYYEIKTIAGHVYITVDMTGYFSNYTDFDISNGEVRWMNFTLYPMLPENVTLKGYINDSVSNAPIDAVGVEISGYGSISNFTNTDSMGYYEMMVSMAEQNVFVSASMYGTNSSTINPTENVLWLNMSLEPDTSPPVLSAMAYLPKTNISLFNPLTISGNITEKYFRQDLVYFAKCRDDTGSIRNYTALVVYSNLDSPDAYPVYTKKMDLKQKTGYEYGWNFTWNATGGGGLLGNSSGAEYIDSAYPWSPTEFYIMGQYSNATVPVPGFAFAIFDMGTGALAKVYAGMGETTPQSDPSGLFASSCLTWQVDVNSKNVVGASIETGTFYSVKDVTITLTSVVPSGDYAVIEQASDYGGNNNIRVGFLTVDTDPPVADAGAGKNVKQHDTVLLDAGMSADNSGITNYTWEYSDGAVKRTLYGVTHSVKFSEIGNHTVWLNVTDGAKNKGHDMTWVTVTDGEKPVADAGSDQTAEVSHALAFNGAGSTDNVGIVNYTWTFSDGGAKEIYGKNAAYAFKNLGKFTVTLKVTDGAGLEATDSLLVTVVDTTPPVAEAGAGKTVKQNESFELNASASTDNAGIIKNYTWIFFDGKTKHTLYGKIVSTKMTVIENHTVTLNITDGSGNTANDTTWVLVTDGTPPVADACTDQTVEPGATVTFDGSGSTDNVGIVNYAWTFNDNGTRNLTGKTATYKFTATGNYTVTLTVKDAAGNNATATMTVHVTAKSAVPSDNAIDNNMLIAAAAAVVAIVVIAAASIALRRKGKKSEPEKPEDKPKEEKKEEEKPEEKPDEKPEKEPDKNAKTDDESKEKSEMPKDETK